LHQPLIYIGRALVMLALAGCGARSSLYVPPECDDEGATRPCETICGDGIETCTDGEWQGCSAPKLADSIELSATVRDFHASHPDFEGVIGEDPGIVQSTLGSDGKPVYAGITSTTSGSDNFDQWFRDVPGTNLTGSQVLTLSRVGSLTFRFQSGEFFPIDDTLFGNEGNGHNFHFTLELNVDFRYVGGETFTFTGDDDVFVFINNSLVIDLGGVHSSQSKTVVLDASASALGIEKGNIYPFALFFAERHTSGSSFRIDTSITEFDACP
jgi:fibro-slime domain-containing protein